MGTEADFHDFLTERILEYAEYTIDAWTLDTRYPAQTYAIVILVNFKNLKDRLLVTQTVSDGQYIVLSLIDTVRRNGRISDVVKRVPYASVLHYRVLCHLESSSNLVAHKREFNSLFILIIRNSILRKHILQRDIVVLIL